MSGVAISTYPKNGNAKMFFRQPENEPYFDAVKIFICKANKGLRSNQGEVSTSRQAKLK